MSLSLHPVGISLGAGVNERRSSSVPSVSLYSLGFLEHEHLVPSSVCPIFIDFNYHTTGP